MFTRFFVFVIAFSTFKVLEQRRPFKKNESSHFLTNLMLIGASWILSAPLSFFLVKFLVLENGAPQVWQWFAGILVLDLAIYWQHFLAHKIDFLWRLHEIHHSETSMDVSTGVRFHPLEIVVSLAYKLFFVWLFKIPFAVYMSYEVFLNLASLFSHANIRFSERTERLIRSFWITPSLHRIHHSIDRREENTNFSLTHCVWDRLFGTYLQYDLRRIESISLGLDARKEESTLSVFNLIQMPFKKSR